MFRLCSVKYSADLAGPTLLNLRFPLALTINESRALFFVSS